MYLNLLKLENYRNYKRVEIGFELHTNLILGENGQGKTNLLESIYFLSTGRSHRNSSQNELIKRGEDFALIKASILGGKDRPRSIDIEIRNEGRNKIKVDGVYRSNKSSFTSIVPSVIFTPDDLRIIKSGPSNRRDFLDQIAEKTVKGFVSSKISYNKILNQRNSLLKSLNEKMELSSNNTLGIWEEKLAEYGSRILLARIDIFDSIRNLFKKNMSYFFSGFAIEMDYVLSWQRKKAGPGIGDMKKEQENIADSLLEMIRANRKEDIRFKNTSIGPHRDDMTISLGDMDIRSFGSQGQQRSAAISLKLSEFGYLKECLGQSPILLLDDVLSELDLSRQNILLDILGKDIQTIITAANDVKLKLLKPFPRFEIADGSIKKIV